MIGKDWFGWLLKEKIPLHIGTIKSTISQHQAQYDQKNKPKHLNKKPYRVIIAHNKDY